MLATLVPILAGQHSALAASVFCGSLAGVVVMPLLGAIPLRIPGVSVGRDVRRLMAVCLWILVGCGAITILAFCFLAMATIFHIERWSSRQGWAVFQVLSGASLLLLGQGCYSLTSAYLVRLGDVLSIGRLRVAYGITAMAFSLISVVFGDGFFQVLVPASASLALASVVTMVMRGLSLRKISQAMREVTLRTYVEAWRTGWRLCMASTANGFTAQATGLVVPLLGPLAELWAIMLRIGGGLTTVGQTVVAPLVETDFGLATREGKGGAFRSALRRGLIAGYSLALLAIVACLGSLVLFGREVSTSQRLVLGLGATLLFFGQTALGPVSRAFAIAGWQRAQVRWDLARFVVVTFVVALVPPPNVLVALGAVILVFSLVFSWYARVGSRAI